MPPVARSFVSIVVGMLAAVLTVMAGDAAARALYPHPAGLDLTDTAAIGAYVAAAPLSAKVVMVGGWVLAAFVGAVVASRLAARGRARYAWVVAALFMAATLSNLMSIPHPVSMWAGALLGIPLAGFTAARLAPADG